MKIKSLVTAILLSTCLTSWAWFPKSISQAGINQIRLGQTTEADLVQLFGPPTTRFVDLRNGIALDWFRSVPMPAAGYLPVIGQFLGGLDVEAQQLTVDLTPDGRVIRYEVHSSKKTLKAAQSGTTRETGYSK